jgi:Rac GTPase-activating protein 1
MVSLFKEFLRFALNQEECRQKWLTAVLESQRLQGELEKVNQDNVVLEAKLNHARRLLDKEKKKRLEAEGNSAALVTKLKTLACMHVPCLSASFSPY